MPPLSWVDLRVLGWKTQTPWPSPQDSSATFPRFSLRPRELLSVQGPEAPILSGTSRLASGRPVVPDTGPSSTQGSSFFLLEIASGLLKTPTFLSSEGLRASGQGRAEGSLSIPLAQVIRGKKQGELRKSRKARDAIKVLRNQLLCQELLPASLSQHACTVTPGPPSLFCPGGWGLGKKYCPTPHLLWKGASKPATGGEQPALQDPSPRAAVSVRAQTLPSSHLLQQSGQRDSARVFTKESFFPGAFPTATSYSTAQSTYALQGSDISRLKQRKWLRGALEGSSSKSGWKLKMWAGGEVGGFTCKHTPSVFHLPLLHAHPMSATHIYIR